MSSRLFFLLRFLWFRFRPFICLIILLRYCVSLFLMLFVWFLFLVILYFLLDRWCIFWLGSWVLRIFWLIVLAFSLCTLLICLFRFVIHLQECDFSISEIPSMTGPLVIPHFRGRLLTFLLLTTRRCHSRQICRYVSKILELRAVIWRASGVSNSSWHVFIDPLVLIMNLIILISRHQKAEKQQDRQAYKGCNL